MNHVSKEAQTVLSNIAILNETDQAILKAIRCPHSGNGAIRALETVCDGLDAYSKECNLERVNAWKDAGNALLDKLDALQEEHPLLGIPDAGVDIPVFSLLATPPKCMQGSVGELRGLEVFGRIFVSAVSRKEALRVSSIEAWATLRRARTSANSQSDWAIFSDLNPRTADEIQSAYKWVKAKNLRDLLDDLLISNNTSVANTNPHAETESDGITNPSSAIAGHDAASSINADKSTFDPDDHEDPLNPNNEDEENNGSDQDCDPESGKNAITWLKIKHASYARYTQKFGLLGDRDRLHPNSLKLICESLRKDFLTGDKILKDKVTLAYLSVKSGLPAGKAIQLPTRSTSYPYIDVENKDLVWNYRYCVDSTDSTEPLQPRSDIELIRLAMDNEIAEHLIALQRLNPDAITIGELLGMGDHKATRKSWLKAYRSYLRKHGDSVHPAYDARFAYSGAEIYRHERRNEAEVIFNAQEFNLCATGILHYITLPTQKLIDANESWERYLSFKPHAAAPDTSVKGAIISLTPQDAASHWNACQIEIADDIKVMAESTSFDAVTNAFNRIAVARAFDFIFLTGHRGTRLARLTNRGLYAHPDLLYIYDKDVGSYQSDRVIPCHKMVDHVLAAWQVDIKLLQERAKQLGISVQTIGRRAILNTHPDRAAFFKVRLTGSGQARTLERKQLGSGAIGKYALEKFQSPINIGRHFLVSELMAMGTDIWLVYALTGHARGGVETFSEAMSVSPRYSLRMLGSAIDWVLRTLALAPVAGEQKLPRTVMDPTGSLPSHANDQYLYHHLDKSWRVLPPPFDKHSVTGVQIVERTRRQLMESSFGYANTPDLIVCMAVFDALSIADQKIIVANFPDSVRTIDDTIFWAWHRDGCSSEIVLPVNPRTLLALHVVGSDTKLVWKDVVVGVSSWIRQEFPNLIWSGSDADVYAIFMAFAARWARYQISPRTLAAYSDAIPTVTPSRRTLLRVAKAKGSSVPNLPLPRALRIGSRKSHHPRDEDFQPIRDFLREAGNTQAQTGEELRRARELKEKLDVINGSHDARIQCVKQALHEEIKLWSDGSGDADQFSSLYGYFSDVITALGLLGANDDLSLMNGDEIFHWVQDSKRSIDALNPDKALVRANAPRFHGLKRLIFIGRRLGWDIPGGLFNDEERRDVFCRSRKSAAATLFLDSDRQGIIKQLEGHLNDWEDVRDLALLANQFDDDAPLRHMERNVLRKNCIVYASNQLSVHTDGFSHLKSRHAVRLISIPQALADRLSLLAAKTTDHPSRFALLPDDAGDWNKLHHIDDSIINAMVRVTGEASVRHHSKRGTAICNRIDPNWEATARALLCSDWTVPEHCKALEKNHQLGTANFIYSAREAGHGHSLTTTVYYYSIWIFHYASETLASMTGLEPSQSLCNSAFGAKHNFRKIRQINNKKGVSTDPWKEISIYCGRRSHFLKLEPTDPAPVFAEDEGDSDQTDIAARCVTFMALLMLGARPGDYSSDLGVTDAQARDMDAALPTIAEREVMMQRRRGTATEKALKLDREFAISETGSQIAKAFSKAAKGALTDLRDDLDPTRSAVKHLHLDARQMINRLHSHLAILPPELKLHMRTSSNYPPPLSPGELLQFNKRIEIGSQSARLGAHPIFQVVPIGDKVGAELQGRTSVCCRAYVFASIFYQSFINREEV